MSQPSLSPSPQSLFSAALQDYAKQTGTILYDHPLAKQLDNCDSVDSISSILQEHTQRFREFRGEDGKVIKSLKSAINLLYTLSTSTTLGEGIGIPWPPAKAIFAAFTIALTAVKDVSASYDALADLFESIERFLSRLEIYTRIPLTSAMTNIVIKIMVEILSTLALATTQVQQGRLKKFVKKVLGENEIEAVLHRLDRLTQDEARATGAQTLEVVCCLVQHRKLAMDDPDDEVSAHSVREALELMHHTLSDINKSKRNEMQQDIHKWLSPPDPWKNHNIARESQHIGTGAWWIHGEAFQQWKFSDQSSFIWIHGKPGAGKSVLSSSIIQDIRDMCASGLATLAFFYCDFREDKKKERRGLLSSLLMQLCCQSDSYCTALSRFYLKHGYGSQHASDNELLQCLKHVLELPGQAPAYIVIDALDECPVTTGYPSPREQVLEVVAELVGLQNVRICVTSRPEADIKPVLGPLVFRSVSLHNESGQAQDIAEYIKSAVNTDSKMRTWRKADKELVIQVLTEKADGMFRWAFCQLQYLRHCLRQRIQRALYELPETLDETYGRALEEIGEQNWEYAHRLFQCVAAASRPLHVDELAEFLAFDFDTDSTPILREDWREDDPAHAVLSTCSSLLAVVNTSSSPVIQFAHFSVKEYLTSMHLTKSKDTISRFYISLTSAHTIIAQVCLGLLLHINENITKGDLKNFPLVEYAAEHWVDHARFGGVSRNVQDGMRHLFDPINRHLTVWVWIFDPELRYDQGERHEIPSQTRATPLHYAAFCGLHDVVEFLLVERSQDVNARGFSDNETPLIVASREGHSEVARLLLEHGAEIETRTENDTHWSALERASQRGHLEVIQVLLKYGADVKALDRINTTSLHTASANGQATAARMLLESGSDANLGGNDKRTPLHYASNGDVARVLLEYGADMNTRDCDDMTPLHEALERGHEEVARVLLEHGTDVDARDFRKRTALHLASERGYAAGVQLLLQHSPNIHALDHEGRTPFQVACEEGHGDVIQLLSDHGAENHQA